MSGGSSASGSGASVGGAGGIGAPKTFHFKLVLVGDMSVGKSSMVLRFIKGQFLDKPENTIGAAYVTQTVMFNESSVKFEIWDTAGQERYHSLAPMYYRGAQAAVVVYDITNLESFERAKAWVRELQHQGNPNMVIALAGNKLDLASQRMLLKEDVNEYATENGLLFFETSAKTGDSVNEVFIALAKKLPKTMQPQKKTDVATIDAAPPPNTCAC